MSDSRLHLWNIEMMMWLRDTVRVAQNVFLPLRNLEFVPLPARQLHNLLSRSRALACRRVYLTRRQP